MNLRFVPILCAFPLAACSADDANTDADHRREVTSGMHETLLADIELLHEAALEIQAAAPAAGDRGWDETEDAAALEAMTRAWLRARGAYERTEGALAPLFPQIDAAIDARYEDFLEQAGEQGDEDLFDDAGVTGMHAIERILFAATIPESVTALEASLPGYKPASWPTSPEQAASFKHELCEKLVIDTQTLMNQWAPQNIDLDGAFQGLIALMNEQREKVNKAASEEEESRYAQRTMADIRENLAGTTRIYALFKPWLTSKEEGSAIDADIENAFDRLGQAYAEVEGDAIPKPPTTWSSEHPSEADLRTPFGQLYSTIYDAVDPNRAGSAVDGMNRAASVLGFQEFSDEE